MRFFLSIALPCVAFWLFIVLITDRAEDWPAQPALAEEMPDEAYICNWPKPFLSETIAADIYTKCEAGDTLRIEVPEYFWPSTVAMNVCDMSDQILVDPHSVVEGRAWLTCTLSPPKTSRDTKQ